MRPYAYQLLLYGKRVCYEFGAKSADRWVVLGTGAADSALPCCPLSCCTDSRQILHQALLSFTTLSFETVPQPANEAFRSPSKARLQMKWAMCGVSGVLTRCECADGRCCSVAVVCQVLDV